MLMSITKRRMSEANSCVANDEEHVDVACDNFILPDVMIKKEQGGESTEDCMEFMSLPSAGGEIAVKEKPEPRTRLLKTIKINNKPMPGPLLSPSQIKAEKVNEEERVSSNVKKSGNVKVVPKEEPMDEETSDLMDQSHSDEAEETSGQDEPQERKRRKKNERVQRDSLDDLLPMFSDDVDTMEIFIIPSSDQSVFEKDIDIEEISSLGELNNYSVISSLLEQEKKSTRITFVVSTAEYDGPCTHNKKKRVKVPARNWKSVPLSAVSRDVERTSNFTPKPSLSNKSPMELFKEIWDDTLMQKICQYTNAFATEKGVKNLNLTVDELYNFLGILLLSGYMSTPCIDMYWDPICYNMLISKTMTQERFEIIHKHLQCNDYCNVDASDKLFSIRPVVDQLNAKFPDLLENKGDLFSLEKCNEPYYMQKPISVIRLSDRKMSSIGYKVWCLNTSEGYLLNFSVSCALNETGPPESIYSVLPADCTLHLGCKTTSLELLEKISALHINCIGEMPRDTLTNLAFNLKEKFSLCRDKDITLLLVNKGKHDMHMLATNIVKPEVSGYTMDTKPTRKGEVGAKYPILLKHFNEGFLGTKIFEKQRGVFRCGIRINPLIKFCLNSSMVNVWLLHQALQPNMSYMDFLRRTVVALCGAEWQEFSGKEEDESESDCESNCSGSSYDEPPFPLFKMKNDSEDSYSDNDAPPHMPIPL